MFRGRLRFMWVCYMLGYLCYTFRLSGTRYRIICMVACRSTNGRFVYGNYTCGLCAGVLHVCTFCFWLISVFGQMLFPVEFAHSAYLRMYVFVSRLCSRCNMTSRKGFRALTVWCLWVEWLFAGETRLDSLQVSACFLVVWDVGFVVWAPVGCDALCFTFCGLFYMLDRGLRVDLLQNGVILSGWVCRCAALFRFFTLREGFTYKHGLCTCEYLVAGADVVTLVCRIWAMRLVRLWLSWGICRQVSWMILTIVYVGYIFATGLAPTLGFVFVSFQVLSLCLLSCVLMELLRLKWFGKMIVWRVDTPVNGYDNGSSFRLRVGVF
eukprot:gene13033-8879_t